MGTVVTRPCPILNAAQSKKWLSLSGSVKIFSTDVSKGMISPLSVSINCLAAPSIWYCWIALFVACSNSSIPRTSAIVPTAPAANCFREA